MVEDAEAADISDLGGPTTVEGPADSDLSSSADKPSSKLASSSFSARLSITDLVCVVGGAPASLGSFVLAWFSGVGWG